MPGWRAGTREFDFLLIADPFSTPMQEILSLMTDRYPHGKVGGGLAGGGQDSGEKRLSSMIKARWGRVGVQSPDRSPCEP